MLAWRTDRRSCSPLSAASGISTMLIARRSATSLSPASNSIT